MFGEVSPEIGQRMKYSKWRAAVIMKAIKNGEQPPPPENRDEDEPSNAAGNDGFPALPPGPGFPAFAPQGPQDPQPPTNPPEDSSAGRSNFGTFKSTNADTSPGIRPRIQSFHSVDPGEAKCSAAGEEIVAASK